MANPHESALHYPFGDALPALGSTLEVAPGVRWVRMKLPFALDHINLWLLRDCDEQGREGWTIVDCGIADDATRAAWAQIFVNELQGLPVLRVIVTHMHPDHIGLAHWLCERWSTAAGATTPNAAAGSPQGEARPHEEQGSGAVASVGVSASVGVGAADCRLWISATDWTVARLASQSSAGFGGADSATFFARHGLVDPDSLAQMRQRTDYYRALVPQVPGRYRRLMDGMRIRIGAHDWTCIVGYGHAPEHIALYAPGLGLLISGDMVLPRISTNVMVVDIEPEADPLPLYLASIAGLRSLPAATLVLPSHGKPFHGLHARIEQLTTHHDERYAEVLAACAESPKSAADLLPVLFKRPLDLHQTTFAMGESIAHLHALQSAGRLRVAPETDGVQRFSSVV